MRRDPVLSFLAGAAIGAGLMFLLDPDRGPRRRALARDQILSAGRHAGEEFGAKSRHLRNRARGLVAGARSRMRPDLEDDDVIAERVRSELGRVVSRPSAVVVAVEDGVVTLSGQVPALEREDLIAVIRWVRGVRDLEDKLDTRESASAPGSQG
ncbi:MAG TPA: YtxH domain-containing protein [Gemmatimonadales bacterium]|nr:YtxH domain-containing protein [Gemmatimonadales bacterium]